MDFDIALSQFNAQMASYIIPAVLCRSTYIYSFSISTLEHTVLIAGDYMRSGYYYTTIQACLMPGTQFNRQGEVKCVARGTNLLNLS